MRASILIHSRVLTKPVRGLFRVKNCERSSVFSSHKHSDDFLLNTEPQTRVYSPRLVSKGFIFHLALTQSTGDAGGTIRSHHN